MSTDTPQTWADMARELQAANARLREELAVQSNANIGLMEELADRSSIRCANCHINPDMECEPLKQCRGELAEAKREHEFDNAAWARDNERLKQAEARSLEYKTEHAALLGTSQWQETEIADLRDDVKRLMQTVSECEERALANEKDAGRYRWLRDSKNAYPLFFIAQRDPHNIVVQFSGELADMNIDAAVAGAKHD